MSDRVLPEHEAPAPIRYAGFVARADLLPPEVRARATARSARRLAVLLLLLALVLVLAGFVGVYSLQLSSQLQLSAAQARTTDLTLQQEEYRQVRSLQRSARIAEAAQRVGTATAIDWPELVGRITRPMPPDSRILSVTIGTQSPVAGLPPASSPLAVPRIGEIRLSASGADLTALSEWLDVLKADPIFPAVEVSSANDDEAWHVTLSLSVSPSLTALAKPAEGADEAPAAGEAPR